MKKMTTTLLFLLASLALFAPRPRQVLEIESYRPIRPYETVWQAVCYYESKNDPFAYNPKEGATGIAQIRQCRVDHFNELTGKDYTLHDCYDPDISKEIFMEFARIYRDPEIIARRWNGSGKMTEKYWRNIFAIMKGIS